GEREASEGKVKTYQPWPDDQGPPEGWPVQYVAEDDFRAVEVRAAALQRKLTEAGIDKHTAQSLQRKAAGELTEAIKEREAAKRRAAEQSDRAERERQRADDATESLEARTDERDGLERRCADLRS